MLEQCRSELEALVRATYPDARFDWGVSPEGDTWVLGAYIPVEDDIELAGRLAAREVDFLEWHGLAVLTVIVPA
jgi:hypothetical protein